MDISYYPHDFAHDRKFAPDKIGGENAQIAMKVPLDMTRVFQGTLLMCVLAMDVFTRYRLRLVWRRSV
jgi:ABC-type uncharacterized transport system permease subunit